ncbi:MAG: hypothetical protein KKE44_22405 [Proteobacteria bacterium]|nr:hypothetical protein [Pseudomonadota bacterium]MBU1585487.1 hypothetical protein [Pseudomonadota bacterium]MBU2452238.1 hypothetical protein [Pseudomonadota bacterium]MBU2628283.1 hypothetical protein [Pseudomonadota bacterium]
MNSNEIKIEITNKEIQKIAKIAGLMFLCSFMIPSLNWAFVRKQMPIQNQRKKRVKSTIDT